MNRKPSSRETIIFIAIAVILMLLVHFVTDGAALMQRPEPEELSANTDNLRFETALPMKYELPESMEKVAYGPKPLYGPEYQAPTKTKKIAKKKAPPYEPLRVKGKPKIAIIIDDMGVDRKRSFQTVDIDVPLTLAFLPYAASLDDITKKAGENGHELIIHMPMQATTNPVSLGPIALKDGMSREEVHDNIERAFLSFDGYVGMNNHMGSKFTQNAEGLGWVMEKLQEEGLYFVDSKTIGSSVASDVARSYGLDTATRDVFLDHEHTAEFVAGALRKTEQVAAKQGYAIAIGHPKTFTIEGLKKWIPDAQARGFEFVHASALLQKPKGKAPKVAAKKEKEEKPAVVASAINAGVEPAAGTIEQDDPNSAAARDEILRKLLGQHSP